MTRLRTGNERGLDRIFGGPNWDQVCGGREGVEFRLSRGMTERDARCWIIEVRNDVPRPQHVSPEYWPEWRIWTIFRPGKIGLALVREWRGRYGHEKKEKKR